MGSHLSCLASAANGTPSLPTRAAWKRRTLISSLINRVAGSGAADGSAPSISMVTPARSGAAVPARTGSGSRRPSRSTRAQLPHRAGAEPGRAETVVDLLGPDLDAFNQSDQQGRLPGCGQLGPALAD